MCVCGPSGQRLFCWCVYSKGLLSTFMFPMMGCNNIDIATSQHTDSTNGLTLTYNPASLVPAKLCYYSECMMLSGWPESTQCSTLPTCLHIIVYTRPHDSHCCFFFMMNYANLSCQWSAISYQTVAYMCACMYMYDCYAKACDWNAKCLVITNSSFLLFHTKWACVLWLYILIFSTAIKLFISCGTATHV